MRFLISLFLFFTQFILFAQPRVENIDVGVTYKKMVDELKACVDETKNDCLPLANKLIEKGKAEKVPFMDYLYFNKAYYYMYRNELDSAIHYSSIALEHLNPVERQRSDLECYNILANSYYFKGDLEKANNYYLKIAKILENGGNQLHLGYLYSNIATLLGETGNDDKQIEYLKKSYELLKENKDERFIATVASNLALGYYYKRDTAKVKKWANDALKLAEKPNDLVAKTQALFCLSLIEPDIQKSLGYVKKSVQYADALGDKTHQSSAYYRYAEMLDKTGDSKEALNYAEKSILFSKEIGDITTLSKASVTAGNIYYNQGFKEKASDYYHTYAQYNDSILSNENKRLVNDLNTKYETEKKEKQIAEQELKIQKQRSNLLYAILVGALLVSVFVGIFIYNQKAQKLKLKQLQQEKENAILNSFIMGEERERRRISQDLHDGVAAMIGAAKMSLDAIPHLPEDKRLEQFTKVKGILENTHADVRHIAHNLLPTVLEKEGLIKATSHFAYEINQTKLLNILVTDDNSNANILSPQLQLMLFRVIQELINNIVKHSQAQNAEIIFSNIQGVLQIEISDDGIGYEYSDSTGNQGLYSITQRLNSIGGNFKIARNSTGGTQAKVELVVSDFKFSNSN